METLSRDKRKKILILSDDLRVFSGVGTVTRELILGTAHHFNWVNLGSRKKKTPKLVSHI